MTHVAYPPPQGNLLVPLSSRAALRAGISMWSACRPMARMARSLTYHAVGLLGTFPYRLMSPVDLAPPVDPAVWDHLSTLWVDWFGPFDEVVLYRPRQEKRTGFAALLLDGGNQVGFVKWRADWDYQPEAALIEIAAAGRSFTTPPLAGFSTEPDWSTIGLGTIPPGLHSPRLRQSPADIAAEVADLLDPIMAGDPDHEQWRPMHGDMGPWNLRHLHGSGAILFDWELARRGPPGADVAFHVAASRAMRIRTQTDVSGLDEAARFWAKEIPNRFAKTASDQRLADSMLSELSKLS